MVLHVKWCSILKVILMPLILYHNAWEGCRNACQVKDNSNNKQNRDADAPCQASLHQKMIAKYMLAMLQGTDAQILSAGVCQTGADIPCIHVASASSKPDEQYGGGWRTRCIVQGGSHGPQASAASGQNPSRHAALLALSQKVIVCFQQCCLCHQHCYIEALHLYLDNASPSVQHQHHMQ